MKQESLLPDTHAIMAGTLEMERYRGKWLVRYKSLGGDTFKKLFPAKGNVTTEADRDEAFEQFCKWREELRAEARQRAEGHT